MIPNRWYAVLDANEVRKDRTVGVTRLSRKMVLWRDAQNRIFCIADKCCHRGAALSRGGLCDGRVLCPFHGFAYDGTGRVVSIPANGKASVPTANFKVDSFTVREAYGFIWIWNGAASEDLPPIPFFEELKHGWTYGQFSENWNVHYTRAIENQLDVVHLPFVHRTTIGRGGRTLVNGPVVKWDGDLMTYYVYDVKDEGQKPLKPAEIEDYEKLFSLQYLVPNLWQNKVAAGLRIMAAFAPVDEENTRIYLRFYQKFVKAPVFRDAVNNLGNAANRVVLHQDRWVVLTQIPKKSELSMGENLVQGDLPIIEFRKKRQELRTRGDSPHGTGTTR